LATQDQCKFVTENFMLCSFLCRIAWRNYWGSWSG